MDRAEARKGVIFGVAAYLWWGLSPIYFKALKSVPVHEVLAHRVAWSTLFLYLLLRKRRQLASVMAIVRTRGLLLRLCLTTGLLAANWCTFIYTVVTDQVLQASLGYYINPLVNVLLGAVVLKERLSKQQAVSVGLAAIGVTYFGLRQEGELWPSLVLACSFGFYGLLRKSTRVEALPGLAVEVALVTPIGLAWITYLSATGQATFGAAGLPTSILLAMGGIITAVPLLWFGEAARRLRLMTIGFLQYLAPTMQFLLAVLFMGETFTAAHAVSFAFIWAALALYSYDAAAGARRRNARP